MTNANYQTHLEKEYCERRDLLAPHFPEAHRFLITLEHLCVADPRFHLGTAKNLHLYIDDRFLAYIAMDRLATSQPRMLLSPEPHVHIKEGTRLDPAALLPRPVDHLIIEHGGYRARWAFWKRERFEIHPGAPDAFFADLLRTVRSLA